MALKSFGTMNVDWEERVNFERLRTERLSRIKGLLKESELGALLTSAISPRPDRCPRNGKPSPT